MIITEDNNVAHIINLITNAEFERGNKSLSL
jgi:hypothetical protein